MRSLNKLTKELRPYPTESLNKIKADLVAAGKKIYDFGTGDPKIATDSLILEALHQAIPKISQYPSVRGTKALKDSQFNYLKRHFKLADPEKIDLLPSAGSKEAIFHIALCLADGDASKNFLIYPDPGYPVYRSSALFSGLIPFPVEINEANAYRLEPWKLAKEVQSQAKAIWVNYPHNPTGAMVDNEYWEKLVAWGQENNCFILSDDCYIDIYDPSFDDPKNAALKPRCILEFGTEGILSFHSLSKRSGLTGFRSGFIAGDKTLMTKLAEARANMGVASPPFVQDASVVAWNDDRHVVERRKIFHERLKLAGQFVLDLGLIDEIPRSTFYLWCRVPDSYNKDDLRFCLELASKGVIASPSQWLSEGIKGYFRLALVPELDDIKSALAIIKEFVK